MMFGHCNQRPALPKGLGLLLCPSGADAY